MDITKNNKDRIKHEIERITGIQLNTWYFKEGCKSLKIQYWLTGSNKIAIRFMNAGEQSEKLPGMPKWWTLNNIRYYTTLGGALKRITNHYAEKFAGYETYEQQQNKSN